jgi:hypothetical protein
MRLQCDNSNIVLHKSDEIICDISHHITIPVRSTDLRSVRYICARALTLQFHCFGFFFITLQR